MTIVRALRNRIWHVTRADMCYVCMRPVQFCVCKDK